VHILNVNLVNHWIFQKVTFVDHPLCAQFVDCRLSLCAVQSALVSYGSVSEGLK
jgi:hypothetical protein